MADSIAHGIRKLRSRIPQRADNTTLSCDRSRIAGEARRAKLDKHSDDHRLHWFEDRPTGMVKSGMNVQAQSTGDVICELVQSVEVAELTRESTKTESFATDAYNKPKRDRRTAR